MASNPSVLTSLNPGANIGGSSVAVPPVPNSSYGSASIGGTTNPFLPVPTTGTSVAPLTSSSTSAPTSSTGLPIGGAPGVTAPAVPTSGATAGLGGLDLYSGAFGGGQNKAGIIKGLEKTGIPGGIAALLAEFLQSGAGFNPQVAQALINAMGPSIERGTENIAEQFSALGNRFGSPTATGIADYMSQVNLNIGEIFSQLYEQSVSNYLNVLMGAGKKAPSFGDAFKLNLGAGLGSGLAAFATGT